MNSKKRPALAVIAVLIIITELVTIAALWVLNSRYKFLYEEALKDKIAMQEQINSMQSGEADSGDELPFVTVAQEENNEDGLPFVTGGGTE